MMAEKNADHTLKHAFQAPVVLADAELDPIRRNAPCLVYDYSENASGTLTPYCPDNL